MQFLIIFIGALLIHGAASAHGSLHWRIESLTDQVEKDPGNIELLLKRGELYRQHQEWQSALDNLSQALQRDPENSKINFFIGRVLYQGGKPSAAIPHLRRFVRSDPDHSNALLYTARSLAALEMPEDASKMYRRAIANAPVKTPDHYLEWSDAHFANNASRLEGAIAILDDGIAQLGPVVSMVQRAIDLEWTAGDLDGAMRYLDMLPSDLASTPRWLTTRAELLRESRRIDGANRAYRQAMDAIDNLPAARRNAPALTELGQYLRLQLAQ
jgi:tetratricopeptide (TPR) repeat protein